MAIALLETSEGLASLLIIQVTIIELVNAVAIKSTALPQEVKLAFVFLVDEARAICKQSLDVAPRLGRRLAEVVNSIHLLELQGTLQINLSAVLHVALVSHHEDENVRRALRLHLRQPPLQVLEA